MAAGCAETQIAATNHDATSDIAQYQGLVHAGHALQPAANRYRLARAAA